MKSIKCIIAAMILAIAPVMAGQAPGQNGLMAFWYESSDVARSLAVGDPAGSDFEIIVDSDADPVISFIGHTSWSPDGNRIAFSAFDDDLDEWVLYVVNVDGTGLEMLYWDDDGSPEPLEECYNFEWAEDGMIYAACFGDSPDGMAVFDPDSGQVDHLCSGDLQQNPALSPDQQTLVSVDWGNVIQISPASDPCDVSTISTTPDDIEPSHTIWAPDGNTIFFTDRSGANPRDIAAVSASGGSVTVVVENAFTPNPSPDGQLLGYVDWDSRHVTISDVDGSNPVDLFAQWGIDGEAGGLSWAPAQVPPVEPLAVPTQSKASLILLILLLAGLGLLAVRRVF